jgi:hypothetical protein
LRCWRWIEIGYLITARLLIEVEGAFVCLLAVPLDLYQQGVSAPKHVPHNTGRPKRFGYILVVEP